MVVVSDRHTKILDEILSTTSNLKMSLSNIKPILTSDLEESTLHASEVLKSKADREKDKKIIFELFSIDSFYDIDLSTNNTRKTDLVTKLRTSLNIQQLWKSTFINQLQLIETY